jgi:hypothetical protein
LKTGQNILTNPFAFSTTLGASGLQAAITGGTSAGVADQVRLESGGVISSYFFKLAAPPFDLTTGWRLVSAPAGADQAGTSIPSGKAFIVRRLGADTEWTAQETFVTGP